MVTPTRTPTAVVYVVRVFKEKPPPSATPSALAAAHKSGLLVGRPATVSECSERLSASTMSALTAGSLMMKSPLAIGDATRRVASRPVAASRRGAALCSSLQSSAQHTQKEVRVVVSHDGRLVSADLPSGTYTVSSWWNGAATRKEKALDAVPACDARQGTDCALFCTWTSPGDLICEGITEGVYQVVSAEPTEQCSFVNGVANCGDGGAQNTDAARWTSVPKSHVGALGG